MYIYLFVRWSYGLEVHIEENPVVLYNMAESLC